MASFQPNGRSFWSKSYRVGETTLHQQPGNRAEHGSSSIVSADCVKNMMKNKEFSLDLGNNRLIE